MSSHPAFSELEQLFVKMRITDVEGKLRPVERVEQLQLVPARQIMWIVVFTDKTGKLVRCLLREYLQSIE